MLLNPEIEKITVLIWFGVLFIIMVVVASAYNEYCELVKKEKKDLNPNGWVAGTYWVTPESLVPINEKNENEVIQKVLNRHTNAVKFFWFWVIIVLGGIILIFSYI